MIINSTLLLQQTGARVEERVAAVIKTKG